MLRNAATVGQESLAGTQNGVRLAQLHFLTRSERRMVATCAFVISNDRSFLERIASHIVALPGGSNATSLPGVCQDHTAPRLLKTGRTINRSAPAWNRNDPQRLSVLCISHPQAIENPKSTSRKTSKFGA